MFGRNKKRSARDMTPAELQEWIDTELPTPRLSARDYPKGAFDTTRQFHLWMAMEIVGDYGEELEKTEGHGLFRPLSMLPHPPAVIRAALEALIALRDGRAAGPSFLSSGETAELMAGYSNSLDLELSYLDAFIDAPPEEIPRDQRENASFGFAFMDGGLDAARKALRELRELLARQEAINERLAARRMSEPPSPARGVEISLDRAAQEYFVLILGEVDRSWGKAEWVLRHAIHSDLPSDPDGILRQEAFYAGMAGGLGRLPEGTAWEDVSAVATAVLDCLARMGSTFPIEAYVEYIHASDVLALGNAYLRRIGKEFPIFHSVSEPRAGIIGTWLYALSEGKWKWIFDYLCAKGVEETC